MSPLELLQKSGRRLRYYLERAQLSWKTARLLTNGRELREMASADRRAETSKSSPVLRFRSGLKMSMVPGSGADWDLLFREVFVEECYRPSAEMVPRDGWTILDLGANMGFFTCRNSHEFPGCRVIAVEPMPLYAQTLRKNVEDNRLSNVQVIEGAICGEPDMTIPIQVWYTADGELKTGTVQPSAARTETITAEGHTLREVFELGEIEVCHLMKVDIEGGEYELFEKAPVEIWQRIQRIVMEVHNDATHHESQIVQILERNYFQVHLKRESSLTSLLWAVARTAP